MDVQSTNKLRKLARLAGLGYLIIFVSGIYANFFILEQLIVPGDASQTASNISENVFLFRMGILSFFVMVIFDLFLAWFLYELLKPVDESLSRLAAWLRLVNAGIFGMALYHLLNVLLLIGGETYLSAMSTAQIDATIMLSLGNFNQVWLIGLVFFGLHLLVLGYLIYHSQYIPRILGILIIIAALGYLTDSFANFLMANYAAYADVFSMAVVIPGVIGELAFTLWLLIKGIRKKQIYGSSTSN